AGVLPHAAQHVPVEPLDRARVLTDQEIGEVADATGDAVGAPVVAALAPADQAAVGLEAHEGPRPPAPVAVQRLHPRDLHQRAVLTLRSSYGAEYEKPLIQSTHASSTRGPTPQRNASS